jgi:uncharacterized OB-fold protein
VQSFTEVFEDRSGHLLDEPQIIAQVIFPEAAVGSLFGFLELEANEKPMIGMSVNLVKTSEVGPEHVKFRSKQ